MEAAFDSMVETCASASTSTVYVVSLPLYYVGYALYLVLFPLVAVVHYLKLTFFGSWTIYLLLVIPNILLTIVLFVIGVVAVVGLICLYLALALFMFICSLPLGVVLSPMYFLAYDTYWNILSSFVALAGCPAGFVFGAGPGIYDNLVYFRCIQHATYFDEGCDGLSAVWALVHETLLDEMGKRCFDFGDHELCVDRAVVEAYAPTAIARAAHDFADLSDYSQTQQRFLELVQTYDRWERPWAYVDTTAHDEYLASL